MSSPAENPRTITLTDKNFEDLLFFANLSGSSHEELVNFLLADELTCFNPDPKDRDEYVVNVLGCLKYKDKESARRTLDWCTEYIEKLYGGMPKKFRTSIRKR
jgi:hypothetical protein